MNRFVFDFKIRVSVVMVGILFAFPAQAGWLSSWFTPSSETQATSTTSPSSVLGTVQPASPPAQYGGPRVLTVSPKGGKGSTEIIARDLDMQRNVIADRMKSNANMMEMILKNRAVAEEAARNAQKSSSPTSPTPSTRPVVRAVVPVAPVATGMATTHSGSSVITPILPSGLKPVSPKGQNAAEAAPTVQGASSGIQPILPNMARPAPTVKKDNKP